MNEAHGYSVENFLKQLPSVLSEDPNLYALSFAIAKALLTHLEDIPMEMIYPRIDELPESLCDILAKDFNVDWYNYNYSPVSIKRNIIKSNWHVHRLKGTKAAISEALSNIYQGSGVQEWFEYGGEPFYFRIIIEMSRQVVDLPHDEIVRMVNAYKSLRSHLEDDAIAYRTTENVQVTMIGGNTSYSARMCGTDLGSLI